MSEVEIIQEPAEMRRRSESARMAGKKVVLVPTMGFLHEGHLSLCRIGRELGDLLLISIFVNPTQFGPAEDLDKYPRDLDSDLEKAASCDVDLAFVPRESDVYPSGYQTFIEVVELSKPMCGTSRPTHFRGVATVVTKLFNITRPHFAVFGEKDFQQLQVIRRMVEDLNMDVEIVAGKTVREADGLAMSSRNAYLDPSQRAQATCLHRGLARAKELFDSGERDASIMVEAVRNVVEAEPDARVDYIELRHPTTLDPLSRVDDSAVIALAVFLGKTRLIDNVVLGG